MKNTPENKARFFALYWGQKVHRNNGYPEIETDTIDRVTLYCVDKNDFLELKPLSSISEEDARFLGYPDAKSATTTYFKTLGKYTNDADYLRSKGYALPWMGLSVEQLINYGWIKLRK